MGSSARMKRSHTRITATPLLFKPNESTQQTDSWCKTSAGDDGGPSGPTQIRRHNVPNANRKFRLKQNKSHTFTTRRLQRQLSR